MRDFLLTWLFILPAIFAPAQDRSLLGDAAPQQKTTPVLTYPQAYKVCMERSQPLVVYVESDGCAPCRAMWSTVMEPMIDAGEWQGFVLAKVNVTQSPEFFSLLRLEKRATPSLVVYYRLNNAWQKLEASGRQSRNQLKELIRCARGEK